MNRNQYLEAKEWLDAMSDHYGKNLHFGHPIRILAESLEYKYKYDMQLLAMSPSQKKLVNFIGEVGGLACIKYNSDSGVTLSNGSSRIVFSNEAFNSLVDKSIIVINGNNAVRIR